VSSQFLDALVPLERGAMRNRSEFGRSNLSCEIIFLLAFLVVSLTASAQARKSQAPGAGPPKYDLHTEAKFKGTIEELKLPPKGSEKEIAHLLLKNGADTVDVYLCPRSFLDDMGMGFAKGDEIALTGSRVKQDGADLILAREVAKGNDTFVLRDEKGGPVWNWRH
jgi:hypothetical protein